MSQKTKNSLTEEVSTPTKRQTRSSSVCSDVSELDSQEPLKSTRRSTRLSVIQTESTTEQRPASPKTRKSVQNDDVIKTRGRTRTSSVSSILSDSSEISQVGSTVATSINAEVDSQTPLRPSRRSAQIAKEKIENLTIKKQRASSLTQDVSSEDALNTPSISPNRLEASKYKDSPYKSLSNQRRSRRLSNSFVDEDGAGTIEEVPEIEENTEIHGAKRKLLTKQYETIDFSTDEENETKYKANDKKRKSILPAKSDYLVTIKEVEDEIEEKDARKLKTPTNGSKQKIYASPKKSYLLKDVANESSSPAKLDAENDSIIISPGTTKRKSFKNENTDTCDIKTAKVKKSIENKNNDLSGISKVEIKEGESNVEHRKRKSNVREEKTPLKKRSIEKSPTPVAKTTVIESLNKCEEITLDDDDDDAIEEENIQEIQCTTKNDSSRSTANTEKGKSPGAYKQTNTKIIDTDHKDEENPNKKIENSVSMEVEITNNVDEEGGRPDESEEERIKKIKLEKLKLKLQRKKEKYLKSKKRSKYLKKMQKLKSKQSTNNDVLKVQEKSSNKNDNKENFKLSEEERLLKILEKRERKKKLWLEKLHQKKLERKKQKSEELLQGKNERRLFFQKSVEAKNEEKAKKKRNKKNKKKRAKFDTANSKIANESNKPEFCLQDIIAKLDSFTSSTKKPNSTERNFDSNSTVKANEEEVENRGKPKSGRFWKETKNKFSTMVKTPGLRRPHSEKEKLRGEIQKNKELTRHILDEQAKAKEEHRLRRIENIKRRDENAKKAEIVQVIKNPAKLKRLKKKQLRMIEKRDTLPLIEKRKEKSIS